MNAYKYQKFLEGLNNLRGIRRLQAALNDCVNTSGVSECLYFLPNLR